MMRASALEVRSDGDTRKLLGHLIDFDGEKLRAHDRICLWSAHTDIGAKAIGEPMDPPRVACAYYPQLRTKKLPLTADFAVFGLAEMILPVPEAENRGYGRGNFPAGVPGYAEMKIKTWKKTRWGEDDEAGGVEFAWKVVVVDLDQYEWLFDWLGFYPVDDISELGALELNKWRDTSLLREPSVFAHGGILSRSGAEEMVKFKAESLLETHDISSFVKRETEKVASMTTSNVEIKSDHVITSEEVRKQILNDIESLARKGWW